VEKPIFFIFSDDIDWCKKNLILDTTQVQYVVGNNGINSFRDMQLMSICKHNIITNSSFSWWAATLNKNPNKVIVFPRFWFNRVETSKDRCPSDWIKI
jgi:hypothetical protein